jgi:hypothetical protein
MEDPRTIRLRWAGLRHAEHVLEDGGAIESCAASTLKTTPSAQMTRFPPSSQSSSQRRGLAIVGMEGLQDVTR